MDYLVSIENALSLYRAPRRKITPILTFLKHREHKYPDEKHSEIFNLSHPIVPELSLNNFQDEETTFNIQKVHEIVFKQEAILHKSDEIAPTKFRQLETPRITMLETTVIPNILQIKPTPPRMVVTETEELYIPPSPTRTPEKHQSTYLSLDKGEKVRYSEIEVLELVKLAEPGHSGTYSEENGQEEIKSERTPSVSVEMYGSGT
jgi:hypothetical protein